MERREDGRDWAYRVDSYGFERPEDFDYASYEAFFSRYLVVLTRRAIKWSKLLKGNKSIQKSLKASRQDESWEFWLTAPFAPAPVSSFSLFSGILFPSLPLLPSPFPLHM